MRSDLINLDPTIIGKAAGAQPIAPPIAAPTIHPVGIIDIDRCKNRDQEIAPTDIGYRGFVVSWWEWSPVGAVS